MSAASTFVRDRLDPVPAAQSSRPLPMGIAAFAILGLLLYSGFAFQLPFVGSGGGTLARVEVLSADAVSDRTPVRVRGVDVGRVDHVAAGPDGRTSILVLRISDHGVRVKRDARAVVRWRTLLGAVYVDLNPGSPAAPTLGDGVIGHAQTGTQVDWGAFNGIFGQPARQGQRLLLAALRRALTARQAHGRTLRTLGPALATIGRGTGATRGVYDGELTRLVQTTGRTLHALSRDGDSLGRLVDSANHTLAASAHHRRALGAAVALSPAALSATAVTMRRLVPTLDHLDPLVAQLRPGVRRLDPRAASRARRDQPRAPSREVPAPGHAASAALARARE
jgi:phospholipid/cholesterol/gamma-HCH transport system substrate-binding protein